MDVVPNGFSTHDDGELRRQLDQTASRIALQAKNKTIKSRKTRDGRNKQQAYLFITVLSQDINRLSRKADCFPFEEGDVKAGRVIVDELKQEHLQGQTVLVVCLCPRELCHSAGDSEGLMTANEAEPTPEFARTLTEVGDPDGDALVEDVEDHDHDEADEGGGDGRGHLGGDVLLQGLQLLQVLSPESGREGEKSSQAVDGDGHDGCQDQQNLQDVWKN